MKVSSQVSEIDGVKFTKTKNVSDKRGTFIKFHPLQDLGLSLDSVALSINPEAGTLRGLHFQVEPFAENKLITCVQGLIFDVIVDLRPGSRTIGKWTSFELIAENEVQVYLPKGVAHGFQTLVPNSIVHYCLSTSYSPESSYSIDPHGDLDINWPLKTILISERDSKGVSIEVAVKKYANSIKP